MDSGVKLEQRKIFYVGTNLVSAKNSKKKVKFSDFVKWTGFENDK